MMIYDIQTQYVKRGALPLVHRKTTNYIVVHHAAAFYRPGTACASIFSWHAKQWPTYGRIGYQWVLQEEKDGSIALYKVNPHWCQGANVAKRNHELMGICCATHFLNAIPSAKWFNALSEAVNIAHDLYPRASIVGHKDVALKGYGTACPGGAWSQWKNALLQSIS